jgi:hypothetical protein
MAPLSGLSGVVSKVSEHRGLLVSGLRKSWPVHGCFRNQGADSLESVDLKRDVYSCIEDLHPRSTGPLTRP